MARRVLVPLSSLFGQVLPRSWIVPLDGALSKLAVDLNASSTSWDSHRFTTRHRLVVLGEQLQFDFPLVPQLSIELGETGDYPDFWVRASSAPAPAVAVESIDLTLRVSSDILTAYEGDPSGGWTIVRAASDGDGSTPPPLGFPLRWTLGLRASTTGNIEVIRPSGSDILAPDIPYAGMIAETGFIVDLRSFSDTPPRILFGNVPSDLEDQVPGGFKGIWIPRVDLHYAGSKIELPPFSMTDAAIGLGGFSGEVAIGSKNPPDEDVNSVLRSIEPASAPTGGVEELDEPGYYLLRLQDMAAVLHHVSLRFDQSLPTGGALGGLVHLPLLEEWVAFNATINGPDGDFALEIGGAGKDALVSLDIPWLDIDVESIAYVTEDGVHWAVIDGSVRPKIPGFDWPRLRVEGLRVSSEGDVDLPGGWLQFPESATIDFHGFNLELSKLGLGTEPDGNGGRRWFGFSGGITLAKGLPVSGSVEGLKFSWPQGSSEGWAEGDSSGVQVSLRGIGVELEIPGLLHLEGDVAYLPIHEDDEHRLTGHIFKGHVEVDIPPLKTAVGGELMIGRLRRTDTGEEVTVVFVVLSADLPTPIPLGASGAGIYRLSGLFGMHAAPDRNDRSWYEWYARDAGDPGRDTSFNLTTVEKWGPAFDEHAFGVGLMVGTQFDDGRTLNVNAMAVVLVPGPVVMIDGTANVLKKMSDDRRAEGAFHALAVIDGRAGTFQLNVDAKYDLQKILRITGSLEAFFNFNDYTDWHLYLGQKTPEEKRIQAKILSIFTAQTYFMIQFEGVQTGAKAGYELRKKLGPARIDLVAILSYDAGIWWKPVQLEGRLEILGELGIKVFGIGLSLALQLLLEAKAANPYWIHGLALIKIKLPWPLPNPKIKIEFTWGGRGAPDPAPFLKRGAMIHHKAGEQSWTLHAPGLDGLPDADTIRSLADDIPVIPVDARPILSFGRPVYNLMDVDPDEVEEWEFTYELSDLKLRVQNGDDTWSTVMEYPLFSDLNYPFELEIMPSDDTRDAPAQEPNVELWRFSPLDAAGPRWVEGHPGRATACAGPPTAQTECVDWQDVDEGTVYPWEFYHEELFFAATGGRLGFAGPAVERRPGLTGAARTAHKVLVSSIPLTVRLPEPVSWLEITFLMPPPAIDPRSISHLPWIDAFFDGAHVATLPQVGEPGPRLVTYGWSVDPGVSPSDEKPVDTLRIYAGASRPPEDTVVVGDSRDAATGNGDVTESDGNGSVAEPSTEGDGTVAEPGGAVTGPGATATDTEGGGGRVVEPGGVGDIEFDVPTAIDFPFEVDLPIEFPAGDDEPSPSSDDEGDNGPRGRLVRDLALLVEICYRTAREERRERMNERPIGAGSATDEPAPPLLPLQPDRTYLLDVTTETTVRRQGDSSPSDPIEDKQIYLFHTGLGPRSVVGLDASTGYEDFSGARENGPADGASVPFAQSRINRLGSYVERTNPAAGGKPFYPAYDISIEFSEAYVQSMYRESERLEIQVWDRNGRPLGEPEGGWYSGLLPLLPAGLLSLLAHQEEGGCLDGQERPASPTPVLGRPAPTAELQPDRRYTAEVMLIEATEERGPLFKFPFQTSRYTDVRAHLESGPTDDEGRQLLRPLATVDAESPGGFEWDDSGTEGSWVDEYRSQRRRLDSSRLALSEFPEELRWRELPALKAHLDAARDAWKRLDAVATDRFDALYAALGLTSGHRPLPPATEIAAVRLSGGGAFLLIESPEPIEWERIAFTLSRTDAAGVSPVPTHLLWNEDRTRAFIVREGSGWLDPGDYSLSFTYQGGLADLPPVSETGPDADSLEYVQELVELGVTLAATSP